MTDDSFQKRIEISVTIYIIYILYIIVKQNPPKNQNCHPSSVICTGIKFMPESLESAFSFFLPLFPTNGRWVPFFFAIFACNN